MTLLGTKKSYNLYKDGKNYLGKKGNKVIMGKSLGELIWLIK